ncbi:conjugative transposon protein TraM [uncultured Muribaculum sp.]|uniref:conjugative transposon protein TraM n=1 Tax=uncultured Muribaculum sp. TaxID=1918613 RepID=UPI0025B78FD1|nr:conjugative transposon protein TraM [uncultured Muribaculum sp.]
MNFQELRTKINDWFESKSATERQKMKKYLLVIPGAAIIFLGSMWLIFGSYMSDDGAEKGKANMELPDGDSDKLQGNKLKALAEAEMQKEKARQDSILSAASIRQDSVPTDTMAASEPSPIEQSALQYQEVQASLDDFYVPENSDAVRMAELQERIDELEAQNAMAAEQAQPDQMELLERSYQLAAQYMGNGTAVNHAPAQTVEEKGKRNVQPVAQVKRNVVSTLSSSAAGRGFNTSVGAKASTQKNTIAAVVAGNQSVTDGQTVRLRIVEPMWIGSRLVPRNTAVVGTARLQGERLEIAVSSVECDGSVYEVELTVYDTDGQEGINIPNSMESDALHEIGANMGSTMGSSINISTDAGAQIASDVGRGLINGVSQYLTKKMRTVKVHLKSGYRVMLHQPEDV